MASRRYLLFFLGLTVGYLIIFSAQTSVNPNNKRSPKKFSTMNETRVIENDDYSLKILVESSWVYNKQYVYSLQPGLPYYFTLIIESKISEVQWLKAPGGYLKIDLYKDSEKLRNLFSISEPYSETMGLFLAPEGKHEVIVVWGTPQYQWDLPNGSYELVISVIINGEESYFDGLSFTVEKSDYVFLD